MTDFSRASAGRLTLDAVLDILLSGTLLTQAQAHEVRRNAERQTRVIERERARIGFEDPVGVCPAELIASLRMTSPTGELVSEERIQQIVANAHGLRYARIDPLKIDARLATAITSYAYARRNCALPLLREGNRILLAVDDPNAEEVAAAVQARAEQPVELVLAIRGDILKQINEIFQFRATIRGATAGAGEATSDLGNFEQLVRLGSTGQNVDGDDRYVVNAVDFLMRYALDQGASDIHIEPKRDQSLVRLRIDGVLHTVHELPKIIHPAITSRIKTMARLDIAEKRRPQDGRVKVSRGESEVEMRISTLPTAFGEKIVLRIFDPQVLLQDLSGVGFFAKEYEVVRQLIARPHGLLLVCGPTGSGKTTTLYSAMRAIATPALNITTIEDPIEMIVETFNQTAVQPRLGLTFGNALRTLLRQDPDVIMVGEIRDTETVQNAIQAAMTGHLVLSTVHTNDAAGTIGRLVDLGAQPYLIASTLLGVVSQRLLRTICTACRVETELTTAEAQALGLAVRPGERFPVYTGAGCGLCRGTGLKGRTGVFEVMPMNDKLRRLVLDKADRSELARQAARDGMLSLREAAVKKMALGLTSFSEVLRVTTEADS